MFFLVVASGFAAAQSEWLTWGHDPERTGSNPDEKILGKNNVSQLEVKWMAQISTVPKDYILSTMTAPVVANVNTPQGPVQRVFVVGSDNTLFAIDAATGKIAWQKASPNPLKEPNKGDYRCPNSQNATPVIDKESGIIYVSTNDGNLRGMSLLDGEDRIPPTKFTDPFARNWSLTLIDGVIYSPTARGCLNMQSHFTALDLKDPARAPAGVLHQHRESPPARGGAAASSADPKTSWPRLPTALTIRPPGSSVTPWWL